MSCQVRRLKNTSPFQGGGHTLMVDFLQLGSGRNASFRVAAAQMMLAFRHFEI